MPSPQTSRPCPWWLPWGVSILIHLVILLVFSRIPAPSHEGDGVLDTRIRAPAGATEMQLFLVDEPGPPVNVPLAQLSQDIEVTPVVPTVASPPERRQPAASDPNAEPTAPPSIHPDPTGSPVQGGAARQSGSGSTTTFFQTPASGRSIVYVVDRSVSMGLNDALASVKRELLASVSRLPPRSRFQVIFFNRGVGTVAGRSELLDAGPESTRQLLRQLDTLRAEGGTDHLPALQTALALEPDVVYFLTDGDDLRPEDVRSVTRRNHGRSIIHAIDFGSSTHAPMQTLAHDNHGSWRAVRP